MKTPPPNEDFVAPPLTVAKVERDRRFLVFAGLVLAALTLGMKSELIGPNAAWWLAGGLLAAGVPVVLVYLWAETGPQLPAVEHYIPALLGAFAIAGLSLVVHEAWTWALTAGVFGAGVVVAARLDYLRLTGHPKRGHHFVQEAILALALVGGYLAILGSPFSLPLKLGWIIVLSYLAAYRSFRVAGDPLTTRRAFLFALLVAQVATFFAWAIFAYAGRAPEGVFAAMLLLAWYINRGVIRHTAEETLTRQVVMEYGLFAALLIFIFALSYRAPA
ncbi:MAG: hypothetical protein M3Z98_03730 [Candidatus Dormibacteraeota bacterium]|nr:hypothetical protein [Candidatus Dormibacteraeota bacterium]